jgi:mannosyltransferase OCH1-like enzyme
VFGPPLVPPAWDLLRWWRTLTDVVSSAAQLWTDNNSREFIETEYAWFLRTYDGYRYPVQRVDALKYFLMLHYGGIYLDLDNVSRAYRV